MPELVPAPNTPENLVAELRQLISEARRQAAASVNVALTLLYWRVGDRIRRSVLGSERAWLRRADSCHAVAGIGWRVRTRLRRDEPYPHGEVYRGVPERADCCDTVATIKLVAFPGAPAARSTAPA